MNIFSVVKSLLTKLVTRYELGKYDQYTIAAYFRKQGAQIGEDSNFNITDLGSEPHLVKIGNHVLLAPGVKFLTHDIGWIYRDRIPDLQVFGKVVIEDNCLIGVNAIILPNVTIGKNSVVAAGAVVSRDVPPNSIVAGNPAKVIGNTEEYFEKAREIWKVQKPAGYIPELKEGEVYSAAYFASLRGKPENSGKLREHLTKLFWGVPAD